MVLSLLVLLVGVSVYAKQTSSSESSSTTETHKAKKSAHHAATENLTAKYARGAQSVSGSISMVDADKKLVVITDSNGVPFDFKVTKGTRIEVNGKKSTLSDLAQQTNKQASVKYRDGLEHGLLAQSIQVSE